MRDRQLDTRWTPEEDEKLRELKTQGKSFKEIAVILGSHRNRNSVAGRCKRLGLCKMMEKRIKAA